MPNNKNQSPAPAAHDATAATAETEQQAATTQQAQPAPESATPTRATGSTEQLQRLDEVEFLKEQITTLTRQNEKFQEQITSLIQNGHAYGRVPSTPDTGNTPPVPHYAQTNAQQTYIPLADLDFSRPKTKE